MPKIEYVSKKFSSGSLIIVESANQIIEEYQSQGFDLTLRQLYYQFVSRDLIANKPEEYKRLGSIINDARLAGMIDWEAIVDRTRNYEALSHWNSPADIIASARQSFRIDKWADQACYVEVWVEKEALAGVVERACKSLDVGYFSCRGYTSQSEMWVAAQRVGEKQDNGKDVVIVHLGDHDPSGIDMTRDVEDRLGLFMGGVEVKRIALNWDQIEQYNPPPNPAKTTDSRYGSYRDKFGDESWELDALDPKTLLDLIQNTVESLRDEDLWDAAVEREKEQKKQLRFVEKNWAEIVAKQGDVAK